MEIIVATRGCYRAIGVTGRWAGCARYNTGMTTSIHDMPARLDERRAAVEQRIAAACARAGRRSPNVTLVAVTKTVSVEVAGVLPELGLLDLGENRPQELWHKAAALPASVRWHLIGHLQRNKVERTLPLAHLLHAVDSVRLLEALEQQAKPVSVLLEVNASGEASKHGFAPDDVVPLAPMLNILRHVRVGGLMTMAALQEPEACRPTFRALRELRDRLRGAGRAARGRAPVDGYEQRLRGRDRGRRDIRPARQRAVRGTRAMIELTAHGEGCVVAVRAQPRARRNGVVGDQNGSLKVAVTAPADRGAPTRRLRKCWPALSASRSRRSSCSPAPRAATSVSCCAASPRSKCGNACRPCSAAARWAGRDRYLTSLTRRLE